MTWLGYTGEDSLKLVSLDYHIYISSWLVSFSEKNLPHLPRKETWPPDKLERTGESSTSLCTYSCVQTPDIPDVLLSQKTNLLCSEAGFLAQMFFIQCSMKSDFTFFYPSIQM
jgi:hypothetical protein